MTDELYDAKCALACNSTAKISLLDVNEIENKNADLARNEVEETGGIFGIMNTAQSNGVTVGGLTSVQKLLLAFK